jgi:hypothetical protein
MCCLLDEKFLPNPSRLGPASCGNRPLFSQVQYPGVARSIEADVDNLMTLISIANILPRGLYVENAVKVLGHMQCVRGLSIPGLQSNGLACNLAYSRAG